MKKLDHLESINIELTTACPLCCPQCYCSLEAGCNLDYEVAKKRVDEAAAGGVQQMNLSGGETMCYPHLYELVAYASERIPEVNIAISGIFFDKTAYEKLVKAGVSDICVSINGSTDEINSLTRDGYEYATHALSILQNNHYKKTVINWVMHSNNADDFGELIHLAERYHVSSIDVIGLKPDAQNTLKTYPSMEQIQRMSRFIKDYRGPVKINVESCFSNFLAYHLDTKLFGNMNVGLRKGCMAGITSVSVDVDGNYIPCRHITVTENFASLEEYWIHSEMLQRLRQAEQYCREPCASCSYLLNCRHCQAINWKMHGEIFQGFEGCPVYQSRGI